MNAARTTHNVEQGTDAWLRLREGFKTASEAPAALGVGKYVTRNELLHVKQTGIAAEHSPATLGKFAAGHAAEAAARPLAEAEVGSELFPVTMSAEVNGLRLLASLDGLTIDDEVCWETKLWNEALAADVRAGTLAEHYKVQMDQELLVSGASRCLFTCTDGTPERFVSCWYEADAARFEALLVGWAQFEKDLAAYVPQEPTAPVPIGKTPETLPALRVEVTGMVTASTLEVYKAHAMAVFGGINRELVTDVQFADAEKTVKWCERVEDELAATKRHALSQTASIDELFRAIDDIAAEARRVRLELDKLVKARKEAIKGEIVAGGVAALREHIAALNVRLGKPLMPTVPADFGGCIKNLRTLDSLRNAVDTELSRAKIAANAVADTIQVNLALLQQHQPLAFLFADVATIVLKPSDDFAALVKSRIADHQAAEAARIEKQREAIRKEEAARLEREAAEARRIDALRDASIQADEDRKQAPSQVFIAQAAINSVALCKPVSDAAETGARIRLGELNALLSPEPFDRVLTLTADGLAQLGFTPVATDKSAKFYRESDFPFMCAALVSHICLAEQEHRKKSLQIAMAQAVQTKQAV